MSPRLTARGRAIGTRTAVGVALLLATLLPTAGAAGDDAASHVWLLSTRRAPHGICSAPPHAPIDYWRLDAQHCWQPSDEESFLHGDDHSLPTTVFVHGNRDDFDDAVDDGWQLYRLLEREAGGRPYRLVIWSWPADRIPGRNRRDVQVKASYSDVESLYLADELHRLDPQTPLCLVGYSLGARVITGALHLLARNRLQWDNLQAVLPADVLRPFAAASSGTPRFSSQNHATLFSGPPHRPIRAVLVAAALDCDWLLPCHRHGLALSQVEEMLVTRNCCDRVLRWYPRMYRGRGPEALGRVGPACGGESDKIELLDVACSVGREHNWGNYTQAPALQSRLAEFALPSG